MITQIDKLYGKSGIYCAIHRDSLMCYVGSSNDIGNRRTSHMGDARRGSKRLFHRVIREFGVNSFDFEILEFCEQNKLLEREKFWIQFMGAATLDGLNIHSNPISNASNEVSEVTRQRMSEASKGRKHPPRSEEFRERRRNYRHSAETLEKMRIARIGRKHSQEHKDNIRQALIGNKNACKQKF